jgi:hypothetical protein
LTYEKSTFTQQIILPQNLLVCHLFFIRKNRFSGGEALQKGGGFDILMFSCVREGRPVSGMDPAVKKETGYIALWVFVLSVIMEAVFLVIRKWDFSVLAGNLGARPWRWGAFSCWR